VTHPAPNHTKLSQKTFPSALHKDRTEQAVELARLRAVVDNMADGVVVADTDGNLLEWNPAALRMHGYASVDEVRRHLSTFRETFVLSCPGQPPLPYDEWPIPKLIRGEVVAGYELHVRRTDTGGEWTIRYDGVVVANPNGGAGLVVLTLHDMTERRRAEAESRRATDLLRAVVDGTTDAVFVKDRSGKYLLFNEAAAHFVGKPVAEVLGRDDSALFDEASAPIVIERDRQVMESGRIETAEERLTAAGVTRIYQATKGPYRDTAGNVIGLIGISRDITERKRAEEALVLFRALIDRTTDGIEVIDPETGRFLDVNEQACLAHGYTREEYLSLQVADIDPLVATRSWAALFEDRKQCGFPPFESQHRRKDGSVFPVEVKLNLIRLEREYLVGVVRDITERKLAEQALRDSEALSHAVWENASDAMRLLDENGNIVAVNAAFCRLFGMSREELIGQPFTVTYASDRDPIELQQRYRQRVEQRILVPHLERRMVLRSGEVVDLEVTSTYIEQPGRPIYVLGLFRNITSRKRNEEALRREREFIRLVLDTDPNLIFVKDAAGRFVLVNKALADLYGTTTEDLVGRKPGEDLPAPHELQEYQRIEQEVLRTGCSVALDETNTRADGTARWFHTIKVPLALPDGTTHLLGIAADITERKKAEDAWRASEARTLAVVQTALDCIIMIDHEGRILKFNPAAERTFGYTREEALGREMAELIIPQEYRDAHRAALRRYLQTGNGVVIGRRLELPAIRKGGERFVAELSISCNPGNPPTFTGFLRDVTDRKRAEDALREERDRFARLAAVSPGVIHAFRVRPDGTSCFPYASPRIADIYGVPPAALAEDASAIRNLFHPDDIEQLQETLAESIRTMSVWHCEYRVRHPVKGEIWVEGWSTPAREPDGGILWHGVLTDVTERKRTDSALRQAQERLQSVISSSPAVLYTLTLEGNQIRGIAWMSENVRSMLGYSPEETTSTAWWVENLHPDDRERVMTLTGQELLSTGRANNEYRFRHRDGQYRWVRSEMRLVPDAAGNPVHAVGSWSDITGHKQIEEQFHQSQKMEAVGRLAGGVAHDFNNLLTVINGYADLLMTNIPATNPNHVPAKEIRNAGERAAGLTAQLLAFSRKAIIEPKVLDLNDVISQSTKLLRRLIGEDITLVTVLTSGPANVKVDPGQIEQVVMNLAVNARDAMPTGGRLTIETRIMYVAAEEATDLDLEPGQYVRLTVTDTGAGMSTEVKARIFEPFFTTKEAGKGTGLGLAMVYGIVKTYRGHIGVESEPGVGTTFTILLPARADVPYVPPKSTERVIPKGTETVLLVEDEPGVRAVAKLALTMQGYTVLEASGGVEAIRVAEQHSEPIHILVTDVVMPGMSGREVAETLRRVRTNLKVLYMSGYTDDAVVRHGIVEATDAFLQKPFAPRALAQKVRSLLDGVG